MPMPKNTVEVKPLMRGPYFSTNVPINPADSPKNKIAREKVHVVSCREKPICSIIGLVSTLQAYTLPIQI